jgi:hypothetical protein
LFAQWLPSFARETRAAATPQDRESKVNSELETEKKMAQKEQKPQKSDKKAPAKSLKEKRADKQAKKKRSE